MKVTRFLVMILCLAPALEAGWIPPKTGFVIHFDCIRTPAEGRALVRIAARAGAAVVNVVPPAHIWESPPSLRMLDAILDEVRRRHLSIVFTRIDASYPPNGQGKRFYYLYSRILTEPGRMPDGSPTTPYFWTTAGREGYEEWMEEETRYYASHYGRLPSLLGFNLGPFSEPFSSERGGFLEWMKATGRYEITQYTPSALKLWHKWLVRRFSNIDAMNADYATTFDAFDAVPLPLNESDSRFGKPQLAYFDFARSLNDWFVDCYQRCRAIWHEVSGRAEVPFILQLSGGEAEKIARGCPSLAAFGMPEWVAMADALGLSLYTNSGFPDMGHASIEATVNLVAIGRDLGKDVFVLEGGNEAPNVTLDPVQLTYFGYVGRRLGPRTYIYEFLKEKFAEEYRDNPGKLVMSSGRIRRPAFLALRRLFQDIRSNPVAAALPALYAVSDALAARGDSRAGTLNAALYDLASSLPIRWIPHGIEPRLQAGVPRLYPDGAIVPANEDLSRLFREIPEVDSSARQAWREAVAAALRKQGTPMMRVE